MKKKLQITIFIFLFCTIGIYAQNDYFYYEGQKVYLTVDKTLQNFSAEKSLQKLSVTPLNFKDFNLETDYSNLQEQKTAKLEF